MSSRFDLFRCYSTGPAAVQKHSYPYDKPSVDPSSSRSSPAGSYTNHLGASHTSSSDKLVQLYNSLVEHMKQMKGARHLWDVAVRRNGMTTSLALLGGVLVADTLLYPHSKKGRARSEQTVMQANLAAAASGSSSSSSNASNAASSSSSGSSPRPAISSRTAGSPAHA